MIEKNEIDNYGNTIMEKTIKGDEEYTGGQEIRLKKVASRETANKIRIYMSDTEGNHLFGGEHADRISAVEANDLYANVNSRAGFFELSERTRSRIAAALSSKGEAK